MIPRKIIDIHDDIMQRNSFFIIADFPELQLQNCRIDIIIAFGIDAQTRLKHAWMSSIGTIVQDVLLERSGKNTFVLYPK